MKNFLLPTVLTAALAIPASAAHMPELRSVEAQNAGTELRFTVNSTQASTAFNRTLAPTPKKAITSRSGEALLDESFEGWDGTTRPWGPEGWTFECRDGLEHCGKEGAKYYNWTAAVPESGEAPEGKSVLRVDVCSFPVKSQDEWAVTPKMTPDEGATLSFMLYYSPALTRLYVTPEYNVNFEGKNNTLEVLISSDNGANWTKVWDAIDDARTYPEKDLSDSYWSGNMYLWVPVSLNLAEYAGKEINIAFRYVGEKGGAMEIDDIHVGAAKKSTAYDTPKGMLYLGFTYDMQYYSESMSMLPAYADNVWTNISTGYTEMNWEHDWSTAAKVTDNQNFIVCGSGLATGHHPTLSGSDDESYFLADPYSGEPMLVALGGNMTEAFVSAYPEVNPDLIQPAGMMPYNFKTSAFNNFRIFGKSSEAESRLDEILSTTGTKVHAVGQVFEAPASPYIFSEMSWILSYVDCTPDATFTLELYYINNGKVDSQPFTTSNIAGSDVTPLKGTFSILRFPCSIIDDKGFDIEYITVDRPIYARLVLTDSGIKSAEATSQYYPDPLKHQNAYIEYEANGAKYFQPTSKFANDDLGNLYINYTVLLDASYPWLASETESVEFYKEGGSKDVALDCWSADVEAVKLPSWIKVNVTEGSDHKATATITAEAMTGSTARSEVVTLAIPGKTLDIKVTQEPTTGIGNIGNDSKPVAICDGNDLTVNATGLVEIYNIAGRKVKTAVSSGCITISVGDLEKGIYIVKTANGNTKISR